MSPTQARVLKCFDHPSFEWSATQLMEMTGLGPGSLYVALGVLERQGWLVSRWAEGLYPRTRLYRSNAGKSSDGAAGV